MIKFLLERKHGFTRPEAQKCRPSPTDDEVREALERITDLPFEKYPYQ